MRIALAHGVLGFDFFGPVHYFNGVARHFTQKFGAEVFAANVPLGSAALRGAELARQITAAFDDREPVHIIAHSMGGLDARWALRHVDGFASRVKTLVMIGTPHRGSPVADAIQRGDAVPLSLFAELRSNQPALRDLTTAVGEQFDDGTPDVDGVSYRYVVGNLGMPGARGSIAFRAVQSIFGLTRDNDGVVTVESATRGGTVSADLVWPVDHAGLIGWNLDLPVPASFPFSDVSHFERYDNVVQLFA